MFLCVGMFLVAFVEQADVKLFITGKLKTLLQLR